MKVLVMASAVEGTAVEEFAPLMQAEERNTWNLYKQGTVREFYARNPEADAIGAIFVFETASVEEAMAVASEFPMVKAGLLKLEGFEMQPFSNFEVLFQ